METRGTQARRRVASARSEEAMKRPLPLFDSTPSASDTPQGLRIGRGPQVQKRQKKQTLMRQFLSNSSPASTTLQADTPRLEAGVSAWTTTAHKQLENFSLGCDTPPEAAATQAVGAVAADTAVQYVSTEGVSPGDDDFRITSSQTYTRTQEDDDEQDASPPSLACSPGSSPVLRCRSRLDSLEEQPPAELETRGSTTDLPAGAHAQAHDGVPAGRAASVGGGPAPQRPPQLVRAQRDTQPYAPPQRPSTQKAGRPPCGSSRRATQEEEEEDDAELGALLRGRRSATPDVLLAAAVGLTEEVTPGLLPSLPAGGAGGGGAAPGSQSAHKGLFNIFRPVKDRRLVTLIRHGESQYNKAVDDGGFKDPMIFDPRLTTKGHTQAAGLRAKMAEAVRQHGAPLWVVSPLTRCLQTFCEITAGLDDAHKPQAKDIIISSTMSEFMVTAGDVGSPTSELLRTFPQFATQLAVLPETWWYNESGVRVACAMRKVLNCYEPKSRQEARVAEFKQWLSARPERFIICVGHCSFWHTFLGKTQARMANCETHSMYW